MQIVKVKWVDSYGATARWDAVNGYKPIILECTSVGFLLYEDELVMAIAPHYAPETDQTDEQHTGTMVIPKKCIVETTSFS